MELSNTTATGTTATVVVVYHHFGKLNVVKRLLEIITRTENSRSVLFSAKPRVGEQPQGFLEPLLPLHYSTLQYLTVRNRIV